MKEVRRPLSGLTRAQVAAVAHHEQALQPPRDIGVLAFIAFKRNAQEWSSDCTYDQDESGYDENDLTTTSHALFHNAISKLDSRLCQPKAVRKE